MNDDVEDFRLKSSPASFIILLVAGTVMLLAAYLGSPHLSADEAAWPRVEGVITEKWYEYDGTRHAKPTGGTKDATRERRIKFEYVVDGTKRSLTEHYSGEIGGTVFLRCPPKHPEKAILEPDPYYVYLSGVYYVTAAALLVMAAVTFCMNCMGIVVPGWNARSSRYQ